MALIPVLGTNKALAKLTMIPFSIKDQARAVPSGPPFVVMYNPLTFSLSQGKQITEMPSSNGGVPTEVKPGSNQSDSIKVDFLLDATGASPAGGVIGLALSKAAKLTQGVDLLIKLFYETTKMPAPTTHEVNIVRLIWGAGLFFDGILESSTITYNLFARDGRPLRATISASFKGAPSKIDIAKIKNFFSSPDVTKTYTVKAGDMLTNLAKKEYGDESLYLELAAANDLKNYRKLIPGQVLIFPPIVKDEQ